MSSATAWDRKRPRPTPKMNPKMVPTMAATSRRAVDRFLRRTALDSTRTTGSGLASWPGEETSAAGGGAARARARPGAQTHGGEAGLGAGAGGAWGRGAKGRIGGRGGAGGGVGGGGKPARAAGWQAVWGVPAPSVGWPEPTAQRAPCPVPAGQPVGPWVVAVRTAVWPQVAAGRAVWSEAVPVVDPAGVGSWAAEPRRSRAGSAVRSPGSPERDRDHPQRPKHHQGDTGLGDGAVRDADILEVDHDVPAARTRRRRLAWRRVTVGHGGAIRHQHRGQRAA